MSRVVDTYTREEENDFGEKIKTEVKITREKPRVRLTRPGAGSSSETDTNVETFDFRM